MILLAGLGNVNRHGLALRRLFRRRVLLRDRRRIDIRDDTRCSGQSADNEESQQTRRIVIHNNLMSEVGGTWGGNGRLFQLLDGTAGVAITNNTAERTTGGVVFGGDHDPHRGFVFKNNVMPDNGAGFVGSGTGVGRPAIERYFPDAVIQGNVFPGGNPDQYPPGNDFSRERKTAVRAGADIRALMDAVDEVASWPN